jgi:hypothetical protein
MSPSPASSLPTNDFGYIVLLPEWVTTANTATPTRLLARFLYGRLADMVMRSARADPFYEEIRMTNTTDSLGTFNESQLTLRLVWPQWQGAGVESIREFSQRFPSRKREEALQ